MSAPQSSSETALADALKRHASAGRVVGVIGVACTVVALGFAVARASDGSGSAWFALVLGAGAGILACVALTTRVPPVTVAVEQLRAADYRVSAPVGPKTQIGVVAAIVVVPFLGVLPTAVQAGAWAFGAGFLGFGTVFILRYGHSLRTALSAEHRAAQ